MSRKTRKKLMTAAINAGAYGADAVLAGTPIAMLTSNLTLTPLAGDDLDRELDDGKQGNKPSLKVGTHVTASGNVEVAGSGTATTPVAYNPIYAAAGYKDAVGATEVEYNRVTDNSEEDVTFYVYYDGALHILLGARATFNTVLKVGELPRVEVEITGLYGGIASSALPAATFGDFLDPVRVGHTHTTLMLNNVEHKMLEFNCSEGNEISYDENTVEEAIYLTDWKSEGTIVIEAPAIATFDPFQLALDGTLVPLTVTHGTAAGNIYQFVADEIELGRPEYGDKDGRMTYSIPFKVISEHKHVTK